MVYTPDSTFSGIPGSAFPPSPSPPRLFTTRNSIRGMVLVLPYGGFFFGSTHIVGVITKGGCG